MKYPISTTAMVLMLLGIGILAFHGLGLSVSGGYFPQSDAVIAAAAREGAGVHTWHMELWTFSQRLWMTVGCLLIAAGRLFDARFHRG